MIWDLKIREWKLGFQFIDSLIHSVTSSPDRMRKETLTWSIGFLVFYLYLDSCDPSNLPVANSLRCLVLAAVGIGKGIFINWKIWFYYFGHKDFSNGQDLLLLLAWAIFHRNLSKRFCIPLPPTWRFQSTSWATTPSLCKKVTKVSTNVPAEL